MPGESGGGIGCAYIARGDRGRSTASLMSPPQEVSRIRALRQPSRSSILACGSARLLYFRAHVAGIGGRDRIIYAAQGVLTPQLAHIPATSLLICDAHRLVPRRDATPHDLNSQKCVHTERTINEARERYARLMTHSGDARQTLCDRVACCRVARDEQRDSKRSCMDARPGACQALGANSLHPSPPA